LQSPVLAKLDIGIFTATPHYKQFCLNCLFFV